MCTVDGEDQELSLPIFVCTQIAHMDASHCRHAVPGLAEWVVENLGLCFVDREIFYLTERDPMHVPLANAKEIADQWYAKRHGRERGHPERQPLKKSSPPEATEQRRTRCFI